MSRQTTVDIKYTHIYWLFFGIFIVIFNNNGTRRKIKFWWGEASPAEMPITRHVQMGRLDDVIKCILLSSVHIRTSTSQMRIWLYWSVKKLSNASHHVMTSLSVSNLFLKIAIKYFNKYALTTNVSAYVICQYICMSELFV